MAFEAQISELIPDGPGDVWWLGPQHARQLVDGVPIGPAAPRAIVLQGLLGRFEKPASMLQDLAPYLDGDTWLIAVSAPRLNPSMSGGFTRKELMQIFREAGYDVASCELLRDTHDLTDTVSVDGPPGDVRADESKESTSARILVSARLAKPDPPECSIVMIGRLPEAPRNAELIALDGLLRDEHRAVAWNRGARMATGKYLAFLDASCEATGPWLDHLLDAIRSQPNIGAAGALAMAFGQEALPCHQQPFPIALGTPGIVPAVDGCGMVVARQVFIEAEGFDPRLGPSFDGPDLCLRLRNGGMRIAHNPSASVKLGPARTNVSVNDGQRYFLFKWRGAISEDRVDSKLATPRRVSRAPAPILWSGPLLQRSGYGEEARSFVLALDQAGVAIRTNSTDWREETVLPSEAVRRLSALAVSEAPDRFINVVHSFPAARMMIGGSKETFPLIEQFKPHPKAVRNIGRTMYETDRIPSEWVDSCNQMDEIWVPANFNVETFARSGVAPEKLFRVPGAIDTDLFDPRLPPMYLPGAHGFVFLSVFAWSLRKGWDVLVRAFKEEFDHAEDVTLVIKALPHWNKTLAEHHSELDAFIRNILGRDPREGPRVLVVDRDMDVEELPRLYRAANAFVLASRGEGYGRPYLEAMAMGLPTIGTRWGGNVDFMNDDNSYLVDCKVVDIPAPALLENPDVRGHRWAEPDVRDLRRSMRTVFEDREQSKRKADRGHRVALEDYSWKAVARAVVARLTEGGVRPLRRRLPDALPVTWEGPHRIAFGIAEVNREIGSALQKSGVVDLHQSEIDEPQPWLRGRPPEVTVRHQWPPSFIAPQSGRWVLYQPWEYGSLPAAWVEPMNRLVDEVWVPSNYVRDCYVRSGVDAGKLAVVPYGIDPGRFHPDVVPMQLPTRKKHRFLFVGGTIARKGIDILLDAYVAAFRAEDDVCLVIKDLGGSTFYHGQGAGDRIKQLQGDPAAPEILYLEAEIPASEMPGLFTACQYLVHPYRGEGFGLPIAEAMASGLAVIVPHHGACLDFCDESVAYLVDAEEVRWPEAQVGTVPTVDRPWWAEVATSDLISAMRHVLANPLEARDRGAAASARIRGEWTWARAASIAAERMHKLATRSARLTACLIVKNEERSLPRCLRSLQGLADEVIVVDTGSTDRSADVALKYGAKVRSFPWSNDFAAARNEAMRQATGHWVLMIDADEWLDAAGRREIRSILNKERRTPRLVRQVTQEAGEPDGVERLQARLFPNSLGIGFAGAIGETLVDTSGNRVNAQPTGVVLHHQGARPGRRQRRRRILKLLETCVDKQPDNAALRLDLCRAYLELGLAGKAEEAAENAIGLLVGRPVMMNLMGVEARVLRARALIDVGRFADASDESRTAIRLNPHIAEAHATLAAALAQQGQLEPAANAYRAALRCPPVAGLRPVDRAASGQRSRLALQAIESRLGDFVTTSSEER